MENKETISNTKTPTLSRWLLFIFSAMLFVLASLFFAGSVTKYVAQEGFYSEAKIIFLVIAGIALALQCPTLIIYTIDLKKSYNKLTLASAFTLGGMLIIEVILLFIEVIVW